MSCINVLLNKSSSLPRISDSVFDVDIVVQAIDIWKRYRGRWVLRRLSLEVGDSSLTAILGRNGVGKTTFIKILCGLVRPTKGKILLYGEDIHRGQGDYKSSIGVLMHENILYEELTIEENLRYYARMYGVEDPLSSSSAREAYELLGLEKYRDTKVGHLSFGWKKRANIVRALVNDPQLVIMDEPTSGLDEQATLEVARLLRRLSTNKTIIFTISNKEDLDILLGKGIKPVIYRLEDGGLIEYA